MLQSKGSQRVRHDWVTKQQQHMERLLHSPVSGNLSVFQCKNISIVLLWIFSCKSLCGGKFSFVLGSYIEVELVDAYSKLMGFPSGTVIKNLPVNAGDTKDADLTPAWEDSPGIGKGNPLQYFCWKEFSWKIPWAEDPGRLSPQDCKESDTTKQLSTSQVHFI